MTTPATHRLITSVRISIGGLDIGVMNWPNAIYLKPGETIHVDFAGAGGQPISGDLHVGAKDGDIVLGPEDYRVIEDLKELTA